MVIIPDPSGVIVSLDEAAATFLNVSPRTSGTLLMFFIDGRLEVMGALGSAVTRGPIRQMAVMRPRDRRAVPVEVTLSSVAGGVRWETIRLGEA